MSSEKTDIYFYNCEINFSSIFFIRTITRFFSPQGKKPFWSTEPLHNCYCFRSRELISCDSLQISNCFILILYKNDHYSHSPRTVSSSVMIDMSQSKQLSLLGFSLLHKFWEVILKKSYRLINLSSLSSKIYHCGSQCLTSTMV